MNFNICIVRPKDYIHSAAFSELAELIGYGIRDLGHAVAININQTFGDARNILIGCHLLDPCYIKHVPHDSIVVNTEQVYADKIDWNRHIFKWVSHFETWDYSELNLIRLREHGAKHLKLMRLGFHPKLIRIRKANEQDIDVLFYGSINDRRKAIIDSLQNTKLNVKAVFGVYGDARDQLISRSKVVLNLHYYNSKIFEVVRVFYLMINSKAVASEIDNTSIDETYLNGIFPAKYNELVDACIKLVSNDQMRKTLEESALANIQKIPQHEILKPLLE